MAHDIPPPIDPARPPKAESGSNADDHAAAGGGREPHARARVVRRDPPPSPAVLSERTPFAWQHGNRLLLLEVRPLGWIMAELRFDPNRCHYVEIRRTRYRWAREAAGALLSRVLSAGDGAPERAAHDLDAWLIRQ